MQESFRKCKPCGKHVRAARPSANHVVHLIISLLTAGLWLPIWLLCSISIGGWRCIECGKKC